MSVLDKAIKTAVDAHVGQVDKGGKSYILHPLTVMLRGKCEDEQVVGVLHDVIEDCNITKATIESEFGRVIADAVDAISRRTDEKYFDYIVRCGQNPLACQVKLYDLEHNLSPDRLAVLSKDEQIGLSKRYSISHCMLCTGCTRKEAESNYVRMNKEIGNV